MKRLTQKLSPSQLRDAKRIKGWEFRELIRAELEAQELSVGWLATQLSECNPPVCSRSMVFRYLNGEHDLSGGIIAECFRALDIEEFEFPGE